MNIRDDYPLNDWIITLRDIIAKREFIDKKDALLIVVEDIEEFLDSYSGGDSPQQAYQDYIN